MTVSATTVGRASSFLAPIVGFSSILLAIVYSPWFSWEDNALSDLGVSGQGSLIFNVGLIVTGIITLLFAAGLWASFGGVNLGRTGAALLALDGLFLSSIGLFPETSGRIHLYVSICFFATLGVALLVMSVHLFRDVKTRLFGLATLGLVAVGTTGWLAPHTGEAIPEAISGLVASIWTVLAGQRLIAKKQEL